MKKLFISAIISIIFLSVNIQAQGFRTVSKPEQNNFVIDYATFFSDSLDEMSRLEVYYQIYNPILFFEDMDEYFEAEYEITIKIVKDKRVVDSYTHKQIVRVDNKAKAKSKSKSTKQKRWSW